MDSTTRNCFIRSARDTDYPELTKTTYKKIKDKFQHRALISNILEMIKYSFTMTNWEYIDYEEIQNGQFYSYLMDELADFINGEKVNFTDIKEGIWKAVGFSSADEREMEKGNMEERLWGMFLAMNPYTNKQTEL